MEEVEQKICPNCKREIPAVNFTIHTVHCARNIRVCPVCKEPVPQADLQEHHDTLHKLVPCKHCGESVCGTDLEDHIRDSCGHTIKSCRYCELELPRRALPAHEGYCGVRTEQCPDCREWVMIKYRQLHLDSNHGFLRLDDDPVPQPKKEQPKAIKTINLPKQTNVQSISNGLDRATASSTKNTNLEQNRQRNESRNLNSGGSSQCIPSSSAQDVASAARHPAQNVFNGPRAPLKRTNDQPQINTAVAAVNKVDKHFHSIELAPRPVSRGAVKKRPAPKPPTREPPVDPKRDLAYYSALQRHQHEEQNRREQSAYNLSVGLPPVLSPAAKLDKLRKMDALQNREGAEPDYRQRMQGRVWMQRDAPTGHVLGSENSLDEDLNDFVVTQPQNLAVNRRKSDRPQNMQREDPYVSDDFEEEDKRRNDFKDLKPMTPQEFRNRFKELQLRKETKEEERSERSGDRFNEIKSSLRELRRGLNEVIAPYNYNNSVATNNNDGERGVVRRSPRASPPVADDGAVHLPCEFCGAPVPALDLVQHQTGCRPDLTQYRPRSTSPLPRSASPRARSPPAAPPPPQPMPHEEPVIPCEFCTESLPVYLISEHQERCGRDAYLLYPD